MKCDLKLIFLLFAIMCLINFANGWSRLPRFSLRRRVIARKPSFRAIRYRIPRHRIRRYRTPTFWRRRRVTRYRIRRRYRTPTFWRRRRKTRYRIRRRYRTPTFWRRRITSQQRKFSNVNKLLKGKSTKDWIAHFEGTKLKVYKDSRQIKTVGVGFNMEQRNAQKIFERYIPKSEVSFKDIFSGKKSLTKDQALRLFQGTLNKKIQTTKNLFPNYDKYPKAVKTALVNGVFRGEFKKNQKTVKYINSGEWDKVPSEYLNRKDYRESKPGKDGGIKTRMDFNAKIFREYAKALKKN